MQSVIQGWLSIWLYVMAGIGIYLVWQVWKNRRTWSRLNVLCTLAVVVLVLHVLEEWVMPGGLHYSYNLSHGSTQLSCYPMNRLTDMVTNFGGVLLGCVVLKVWGFRKPAGVAIMLFCLFEVVIHVVIGFNDLQTFGSYGMNALYSPGIVTSLFGFLPVAVGLFAELAKPGQRPTAAQCAMAVVAMFGFCFLLINLPEMLLSSPDSPYAFTDRGYYERFGEAFEANEGLTY